MTAGLIGVVTVITAALGEPLAVLLALCTAMGVIIAIVVAARWPCAWLACYVTAMMLSPDPRVSIANIGLSFHAGDLLFAGGAIALLTRRAARLAIPFPLLAIIVWPLFTLPSAFALSGPQTGYLSAFKWIRLVESLFPLIYAAALVEDGRRALNLVIHTFLIAGGVGAAYGIAQFYIGFNLDIFGIQYANHLVYTDTGPRLRAVGIFNEASGYGSMCALLIVVALVQLTKKGATEFRFRLAAIVILPVASLGLVLSFARAPVLGLIATICIFAMISAHARLPQILSGMVALVASGAAVVALAPSMVQLALSFRLLPVLDYGQAAPLAALDSGRPGNWSAILSAFGALNPMYQLVGIGYKSLVPSSLETTAALSTPVAGDNQFLTTLVEQGVVGLFVLLIFIGYIAYCYSIPRRLSEKPIPVFADLLLAYWIAQVLVQFPFIDYFTYFRLVPILAAAAGALLVCKRKESQTAAVVFPNRRLRHEQV